MCSSVLGWRLHGVGVYGLHGDRSIAEVVEVLHRRLMVRVVVTGVGPSGMLVLIRVLVVVLVVHLQLGHRSSGGTRTEATISQERQRPC